MPPLAQHEAEKQRREHVWVERYGDVLHLCLRSLRRLHGLAQLVTHERHGIGVALLDFLAGQVGAVAARPAVAAVSAVRATAHP